MADSPKTIEMQKDGFKAELFFDYVNERLQIFQYRGNIDLILKELEQIIKEERFTKVIFYARPEHWRDLLQRGFILEGMFKGFFHGTDCYAMSLFKSEDRKNSKYWIEEDDILFTILQQKTNGNSKQAVPNTYIFRRAMKKDANALAELYKKVFKVYPTPIDQPDYIRKCMDKGCIFYVVEHEKQMISAASADTNMIYYHAEITDCATLPEFRKYGLIKELLTYLEKELKDNGIYCAFSIARALSYGMNAALWQLGYEYGGRMMNNCFIFDKIEDMNIWVKDLSRASN